MDVLCETALLTHGLVSISSQDIKLRIAERFPEDDTPQFAWVEQGDVKLGGIDEYLPLRDHAECVIRVDAHSLEHARKNKLDGALTASGTMEVARREGIPLAVTCGMGGFGDIKKEQFCPDLPALTEIPTGLIATSPKDMLDIPRTLNWLIAQGVHVIGDDCTGYVFMSAHVQLSGSLDSIANRAAINEAVGNGGLLVLNPIPEALRLNDLSFLEQAVACGKQAEAEGREYHPAVNAELDRLSSGYSSAIQFDGFVNNIAFAKAMD